MAKYVETSIVSGFFVCLGASAVAATNDRCFADHKNATVVFYGYDL